jgi:hypothetical protein
MPATHLEHLQNAVSSLGRPVMSVLVPGIEGAEVRAALGDSTPASVVEWFEWCNGVADAPGQLNDDVAIIPGYAPVSIADAVAMRSAYEGDPELAPYFVPLLAGPSGDLYAAVWASEDGAQVASVLLGEPTEIRFNSIEQMVAVFVACIERGAFTVNDAELWSINPSLYDAVYEDLISGSE